MWDSLRSVWKGFPRWVGAGLALLWGYLLLAYPQQAGDGIRQGLLLCGNVVLPSLFCFFVLTNFVICSGLNRFLSLPLTPLTRWGFRLEPALGCVVLMSWTGGYPVGPRAISALVAQGQLDRRTAHRMLWFCCGAGPSFVITAVGQIMLGSRRAGMLLYGIQLLSALLVGLAAARFAPKGKRSHRKAPVSLPELPLTAAFTQAVEDSVRLSLQMCGTILLFGSLVSLVWLSPLPGWGQDLLCGLAEVTNGCVLSTRMTGPARLVLTSFFLSFGGLSVLFQVMGILREAKLSARYYLGGRLLQGGLSAGLCWLCCRLFPETTAVFAPSAPPVPVTAPNLPLTTLCLLGASSLLLLRACRKENPDFGNAAGKS